MFFKTFGTSIAMRLSKPASVFRVQLSNSAYSCRIQHTVSKFTESGQVVADFRKRGMWLQSSPQRGSTAAG